MSRSTFVLPPYPVQIGSIKFDSCEKQLLEYVKCGNYAKVKQMLKKGIFPDSKNSLGQTPLYVAALLGLQKMVNLLLEYGSNPNHRCFDWSTPVHSAAFSCDQWIMSKLIDAGGDLRLHDEKSRIPYDWALMAGRDQCAQILEFIEHCSAHMHVLIHGFNCKPNNIVTSQELFSPRNVDKSLSKHHKSVSIKRMYSFGYGELYLGDNRQVGFIATVPLIEDKSIVQDDCKPSFCFAAGPYMTMTNLMWGCTEVTVKGIKVMPHENCSKERFVDLLIEEQKNISNLHHPLILHLLAVCTSSTLERTQLVFERVAFGSLYNVLHEKCSEFLVLSMEAIVNMLLQAIDALMFLHCRGFIHGSFSSHAIQIVSVGQAKISHFEYMIQSNDDRTNSEVSYFRVPNQLYRWSSPEVVLRKSVTMKSDLYSFCVVMQESLTDCLPWDGLDGPGIRHAMDSGRYLAVDPRLFKPFDAVVETGLQVRPERRTMTLQDIRYIMKKDLKDSVQEVTHISRSVNIETIRAENIHHVQQQCPVDVFESEIINKTQSSVHDSTENISTAESQTDSLYEITEDSNTGYSDVRSSENKSLSAAEDFEKQDFLRSSASSSQQSEYETSLSSDLEEDTDYDNSTPDGTWQGGVQSLRDGLTSILAHHICTFDNLLSIQNFLQIHKIVPLDEEKANPQLENVQAWETLNKHFPHMATDEVHNIVPQPTSKSNVGLSATAPPQLFYVPPDTSCLGSAFVEAQKTLTKTQSECFGGTRRKTTRKDEGCDVYNKFEEDNPQTLNYTCVTSNISESYRSDDYSLEKNRFETKKSYIQQLPTMSLSGHTRAPDWSCKRCPSPIIEEFSLKEINLFVNETLTDADESSETSYFTPERELTPEKSKEKCLKTKSNKTIGEDTAEQSSLEHSGNSIDTTQERNQTECCIRDRTTENDMPRMATLNSSSDSRSIIDVEGLSVVMDLKSPTKHFTPPKSIESSGRHSTPLNQASCSKVRSPEQKSPDASCWASIESYKSTPASSTFLSAYDIQDTPIKNQSLVCIVGSLQNSEANNLLNKTDCECQSMDIASLLNETEKTSPCDTLDSKKRNAKDNIANIARPNVAE